MLDHVGNGVFGVCFVWKIVVPPKVNVFFCSCALIGCRCSVYCVGGVFCWSRVKVIVCGVVRLRMSLTIFHSLVRWCDRCGVFF
ncbi:hypothetical protein GQ457_12G012330 [Hibiscus cannabinus]